MTEVDHYESVRKKMSIGEVGTPKHEKTIEFLKRLYDEEEIKLLDHFDRAYQMLSAGKLAKKANMEKKKVKEMLKKLHKRGVIFSLAGAYMIMNLVPGFFEHYIITKGDTEENTKKTAEYFRWAFNNLTPQMFYNMMENNSQVFLPKLGYDAEERIVEIDEAISIKDQQVLTGEFMREMVDKSDHFATIRCQCREVGELTGNPCTHAPEDLGCFMCGIGAKMMVDQGMPGVTEIPSREEAIKFLERCEKAGLVHYGIQVGPMTFTCNCCPDCCCSLAGQKNSGLIHGRSNFDPRWHQDACTLCDLCVKKCPMEAIKHKHPITDQEETLIFNLERCIGCGVCATNCPKNAISMIKVRTNPIPEETEFVKNLQGNIMKMM